MSTLFDAAAAAADDGCVHYLSDTCAPRSGGSRERASRNDAHGDE